MRSVRLQDKNCEHSGVMLGSQSSCSAREGFQQHLFCWPHSPPLHVTCQEGRDALVSLEEGTGYIQLGACLSSLRKHPSDLTFATRYILMPQVRSEVAQVCLALGGET